ncbi:MAG: hypothetical protein IM575_04020 [Cytophagales bacterium]|nr:hypothetical protein [Cytophagales bacterium]
MHFSKRHLLKTAQFFCIAVILLSSCSEEPDKQAIVYAAGAKRSKAAYWENGKVVLLQNDNFVSKVLGLYQYSGVLHAVGYTTKGGRNSYATYWKSGETIELPLPEKTMSSYASSIFLFGKNIYIAGGLRTTANWEAIYWKNGVINRLTDGKNHSEANAISVAGGDVYVAGWEQDDQGIATAKYWKNGIEFILAKPAYIYAMFITNNDLYFAGERLNTTDGEFYATYWKNEKATDLLQDGIATSIYVSNNDVYVAGHYLSRQAYFWKNDKIFNLTDGTKPATAESIYAINNDVYVAGQEENIARFWKNGVVYPLIELNDGTGQATSIVVRP